MANYRVFTVRDLRENGNPYNIPASSDYKAINWDNWFNKDERYTLNYGIGYGMPQDAKTDYQNNPTKLILRRHISIQSIDGPYSFPDV